MTATHGWEKGEQMKKFVAVIGLLMVAVASHAASAKHDYDPEADFSRYQTLAWKESKESRVVAEKNSLADGRIRAAVEKELAAKGYRIDEAEDADAYVIYRVAVRDQLRVDETWAGRRWGRQVHVSTFQQGTLVLDVVDAETGQLVWRGWVSDALGNPKSAEKRLAKAAKKLLKKFPPEP
jgi:hypothetical protein